MADSNITKRALANALRELMAENGFEKINIGQICETCNMNRRSFYYHFRDKYELLNWIFDTEFRVLAGKQATDYWEFLENICTYFYDNRDFYRKALKIRGQNSFSEHFRASIYPLLQARLETVMGGKQVHPLCVDFLTDGIYCVIERWLTQKDPILPEEFVEVLKHMIESAAAHVCREAKEA